MVQNVLYAGGTGLFADIGKFNSKEELNAFLGQFKSLNINAPNYCNPIPEKKNVGSNIFLEEGKIEIDYQKRINSYNNWLTEKCKEW